MGAARPDGLPRRPKLAMGDARGAAKTQFFHAQALERVAPSYHPDVFGLQGPGNTVAILGQKPLGTSLSL